MASILIVSGPNEGEYYPLGKHPIVVGRDDGCPVQVVDELVSRMHLEIRFDGAAGVYHAADLDSANGTRLNDRPVIAEVALADGDVLALGRSELMFSSLDFPDEHAAFEHHRRRGEHAKSTIIGPPS